MVDVFLWFFLCSLMVNVMGAQGSEQQRNPHWQSTRLGGHAVPWLWAEQECGWGGARGQCFLTGAI